jgi:predicted O-methyltransferase YrrM
VLAQLKHQFRELERTQSAPMVSAGARYLWYQGKNLRDLVHMGAVRRALEARDFPADAEGQVAFVMDRFHGTIMPYQNRWEVARLAERVRALGPKTVLEIGTARGGTLFLLCQAAAEDATIVSLDLPEGRNGGGFPNWKLPTYKAFARPGQTLRFVRGNSHDPASRDEVHRLMERRGIDFIMIDGDHSYEGVKTDFELYYPLLAPGGLLAMHDIRPTPHDPSIDVHRFWLEVKERFETEEIVEVPDQPNFGIGLVHGPAPSAG